MKFFMILKDSFREAVDGFVIYVMVILSTLLIVLVGCIGYEPVEAQLAFDSMLRSSRFVNSDRGRSAFRAFPMFGVSFKIQDLQKLNDASQPQEGDYKMRLVIADSTLGMQPPDAKEKKTDKTDSQFYQAVAFWNHTPDGNSMSLPDANAVSDAIVFDFLKDMFETHGNVNVSEVTRLPDEGRNNYVFQITTKGRKGVRGWLHRPNLFFGAIEVPIEFSLGRMVYFLQDQLVNGLGAWISLLVAVIFTAFFIPNMMRKGAVDLLLSKPIHRVSLLIFKYLGGLMFVFLNTAYAVGGVWLVMGLRSGVWSPGFLLIIFGITFYFAILYAVSTLFGVLTRNAIVAILVTMAFWFTMYIVGQIYGVLDVLRHEAGIKDRIPKWVYSTVDVANAVLPRTKDLDKLTTKLVADGTLAEGDKRQMKLDNLTWPSWFEVLGVSCAHIAIMLGLACWRFATRDH
jgi:ABC-type transport system involved in multi-copper enzyme maturation permease subunit